MEEKRPWSLRGGGVLGSPTRWEIWNLGPGWTFPFGGHPFVSHHLEGALSLLQVEKSGRPMAATALDPSTRGPSGDQVVSDDVRGAVEKCFP